MNKVLIIVDVQNDFCPGGSLAVENGDRIIPNINRLSRSGLFDMVIATQDWHPLNHISFASTHKKDPFSVIKVEYGDQMLWPSHCVQESPGSEFRSSLDMGPVQYIIRKGYRQNVDSYSAFLENDKKTSTGLGDLVGRGSELYIVGIATDVCVYNTAMDALDHASKIKIVEDACAGVGVPGTLKALEDMKRFGIVITNTKSILG